MRTSFKMLAALCTAASAFMSGCSGNSDISGSGDSTELLLNTNSGAQSGSSIVPEEVNQDDITPAQKADCTIAFSEGAAAVKGSGAQAEGTTVTISKAGIYAVSGECSDGKIVISAGKDDEVTLILNGVALTAKNGSAIYCDNADKLTITLADGTVNNVSDTEYTFAEGEDEPDAAIFSRDDTIINGKGTLNVNGLYNSAIKCKDGLKICGGNISVSSVGDGIKGKDYLIVSGGKLEINSGDDGLVSNNDTDAALGYVNITGGEININSQGDGIQAETELIVSGGTIDILTGEGSASVARTSSGGNMGGFRGDSGTDFSAWTNTEGESTESLKGLKAGTALTISGGTITVDSADDSVHSNGTVSISGGNTELSSGDDGVHADALLEISGGEILIKNSYEGLEGKAIEIYGGTISLTASDDGLNAAGGSDDFGFGEGDPDCYIGITGGTITANAGGDGIDSNGTIAMSGGVLIVFGPTDNGNGALDYASSFALSGGTLAALGSSGMAAAPTTLSQPCLSINSQVSAGSSIELRDPDGNTLISIVTPKACTSLILSSPEMKSGTEYGIYADDTLLASVTATDGVSGGGAASGMGGMGGQNGGEKPDFPHGNRQNFPNGEMPTLPNGEMPTSPNGEMPDKPASPEQIAGQQA